MSLFYFLFEPMNSNRRRFHVSDFQTDIFSLPQLPQKKKSTKKIIYYYYQYFNECKNEGAIRKNHLHIIQFRTLNLYFFIKCFGKYIQTIRCLFMDVWKNYIILSLGIRTKEILFQYNLFWHVPTYSN